MQIKEIDTDLIIRPEIYESNRGKYQIVPQFRMTLMTVEEIEQELKKWNGIANYLTLVSDELKIFEKGTIDDLLQHPFWKGEERYLAEGYFKLHKDFAEKMQNSKYATSRNTTAAVPETCVSMLQRHDETLYAVSRSCDISLGYMADLITLYLLACKYKLKNVMWFITVPHVYTNNIDKTITQFKTKTKIRDLIFNKRK